MYYSTMNSLLVLLFLIGICVRFGHSAQILALFLVGGSSHFMMPEAVLKGLASRGHNITIVSHYPQKKPVSNWHDIDISLKTNGGKNNLPFSIVTNDLQSPFKNLDFIAGLSHKHCSQTFSNVQVQDLVKSNQKFDLVITEIFGADCAAGFAWKFNAPLISMLVTRRAPWAFNRVGNPEYPSYLPMLNTKFSHPMTFMRRLQNTFFYLYFNFVYQFQNNMGLTEDISKRFFGPKTPTPNDIVQNTSLVFVNNHFTMDQSHPMVPNYVEIAGVHVKQPKTLPQDLKNFIDDAKQGVIYFTLGSLVRVSSLPKQIIRAFRDAFAELPQKVFWKYELELEDKPNNVFISSWFPQIDIFNHPSIKLFISHGGNSGCIEAVHFGIPMVGIPLFFDQNQNIQALVDKGVAVKLDLSSLTKENIHTAIKTVLDDKRYEERMKELSHRFKDRPISPLDTAVYWTEYVIRHKGAPHLKVSGSALPWFQYFLLDVIAFSGLIIVSCLYATKLIAKKAAEKVTGLLKESKIKLN